MREGGRSRPLPARETARAAGLPGGAGTWRVRLGTRPGSSRASPELGRLRQNSGLKWRGATAAHQTPISICRVSQCGATANDSFLAAYLACVTGVASSLVIAWLLAEYEWRFCGALPAGFTSTVSTDGIELKLCLDIAVAFADVDVNDNARCCAFSLSPISSFDVERIIFNPKIIVSVIRCYLYESQYLVIIR